MGMLKSGAERNGGPFWGERGGGVWRRAEEGYIMGGGGGIRLRSTLAKRRRREDNNSVPGILLKASGFSGQRRRRDKIVSPEKKIASSFLNISPLRKKYSSREEKWGRRGRCLSSFQFACGRNKLRAERV